MENSRMFAIAVLYIAGWGPGLYGITFLSSTSSSYSDEKALRLLTSGLVCVGIASLFIIAASIMAFIAGKPQPSNENNTEQ